MEATAPAPYEMVPAELEDELASAAAVVEANPEAFGYAWFDGEGVVLDLATAEKAAQIPLLAEVELRLVDRSRADLNALQAKATDLALSPAGEAAGAWMTFQDPRSNKVFIAAEALTEGIAREVASIGDGLALVYLKNPHLEPLSRSNDTAPHTAGAAIAAAENCTSGFAWTAQPAASMLTAAHCAPSGATVTVPSGTLGSVTSGSGENWTSGMGTVLFPGDSIYRGDLAMIGSITGQTQGRIYIGAAGSNTRRAVGGLWSRSPLVGDAYCTSGAYSGELCNWSVAFINADVLYSTGETARNITVSAAKTGACVQPGDSGAPVFTVRVSDGKALAKGVLSAGSGGGSDYMSGPEDPCYSVFTDARLAASWFSGSAKTA